MPEVAEEAEGEEEVTSHTFAPQCTHAVIVPWPHSVC